MAKRELYVFAHLPAEGFVPAGLLTLTEQSGGEVGASAFSYGQRYKQRKHAFEIDPVSLADMALEAQLCHPANGLALFGAIRDATPDAWGRRVIEARHKVPANSLAESVYLLEAGSERVGALDVRASRDAEPSAGAAPIQSLQYLQEAAERIERGEAVPSRLTDMFGSSFGAGGARPKASVRDTDSVLWLAKFASRGDVFDVASAEMATLRMAQQCGLSVPQTRLVELGSKKCLLVQRFDRYWIDSTAQFDAAALPPLGSALHDTRPASEASRELRLPFISALTLVGCDEFASRTQGYVNIADAVRRYASAATIRADNRELFMRMVFNILVSNDDDHLRNHAFVRDPRVGGWRLSPLYDVVPRPGIAYERYLHLEVGAQGKLATLDNALSYHMRFGLERPQAVKLMGQLVQKVKGWKTFFEEQGLGGALIDGLTTAFRPVEEVCSASLAAELVSALP